MFWHINIKNKSARSDYAVPCVCLSVPKLSTYLFRFLYIYMSQIPSGDSAAECNAQSIVIDDPTAVFPERKK